MTEQRSTDGRRISNGSEFHGHLRRVIRPVSAAALLVVLALGCRGDRTTAPEVTEATDLRMGPASVSLVSGDTIQLEATPVNDQGKPVPGYEVSWSSGDTAVATVDGDGTVTARSTGSTTVTAAASNSNQGSSSISPSVQANQGKGGDNGKGKKKGLKKHSDVTVTDSTTSSTGEGLITNVEPTAYEKDTLEAGDSVYVDRSYSIDGVPSEYRGWRYVRTANDDKNVTSDSAVTFTLNDTARVALAYDSRATTLPDWLQDWTATGDTLHTTDVAHLIYTRRYLPGDVALGGNLSGGAEGASSMYVLSATPSDSATDDTTSSGTDTTSATVASVTVSPDSAGVTVGGSTTFSATVRDSAGNELDRTVSWSSSNTSVATVNSSGTATGESEGSALIIAASNSTTDSASVTVFQQTSSDVPQPDASDEILYDMRAGGAESLQAGDITSIAAATDQSNFYAVDTERGSPDELGITNTFLGDGTRAIVFPWLKWAGNDSCKQDDGHSSQHNLFIEIRSNEFSSIDNIDGPRPGTTVYLQYKRYFGRTGSDQSASAVGPVDNFVVHHKGEGPGGRKETVWYRGSGWDRYDWIRQHRDIGVSKANTLQLIGEHSDPVIFGQGDEGKEITPWWPDAHFPQRTGEPGGPFTFTLRIQTESSAGAGDGRITYWVDGKRYADRSNMSTGVNGFQALQIGGPTWICPPQDQTEYIWDVVIWEEK